VPAIALVWAPSGTDGTDGVLVKALQAESETAPLRLAVSLTEALDLVMEASGNPPPSVLTARAPRPPAAPPVDLADAPA
jgi:hypothetical protein